MTASQYLIHNHDHDRLSRIGIAEAVFCNAKTPEQIISILNKAAEQNGALLLTHLDVAKAHQVKSHIGVALDYDPISRTGILGQPLKNNFHQNMHVEIITGGTSDIPVAAEAARTLFFHGVIAGQTSDIGVAGLHRLLGHIERLRSSSVIIACAGLDAALPTVLAGLVGGAIVAVPTSIGYGVARGGQTALNALLVSCAPGITVVNIDNGFGAACAALRILQSQNLFAKSQNDV